jgi:hypothetical protein
MGSMSEVEKWRGHRPQTGLPDEPGPWNADVEILNCQDCGWVSTDQSHGGAGFAAHLEELGAPDHIVEYFRFWAGIVETPFGELNREQVAKELFDYSQLMENASRVYDDLAGLSKPNTDPGYIIAGAERKYRESHAYELAERAWYLEQDAQETAAEELRRVAEGWHEGIVEEVAADFHRRAVYVAGVTGMKASPA